MTLYEPRPEDVAWAGEMSRILNDYGILGTSTGIYRIDKAAKTLTLIEPASPWVNPETMRIHYQHCIVWPMVGYTVVPDIREEVEK